MSHSRKTRNALAGALAASCFILAGAGAAHAQSRRPRNDFDNEQDPAARYVLGDRATGEFIRNRRAERIAALSRARTRGEEAEIYNRQADPDLSRRDYGVPIRRGYAEIYDSRYQQTAAEPPRADERPLPPPRSARYDPRSGEFDDFVTYVEYPADRWNPGGEPPGYLTHAGRDSALANGYRMGGVQEFSDARGQGVRLDDVYPLDPSVNPRRYRGHYDWRTYGVGYSDEDEDRDIEAFIRREMMVRPGANLRVSSTGTYDFRHYIEHGAQVNARFRQPAHRRWQYVNP